MANVTPALPFDNFSGKLSGTERIVMRTRNGRTHAYSINNPYTGPLAETRRRVITAFSLAVQQCKAEMADPDRLAYWQDRFLRYRKSIRKSPASANRRFIGKASDKRYSTLRGFIIASLTAQPIQSNPA